MFTLGINSVYHESSVTILENGKVICAVEEERFNRKKHAKPANVENIDILPSMSLNYCLEKASENVGRKIGLEDIQDIGFSMIPEERLQKNLSHKHNYELTLGSFGTEEGEKLFYETTMGIERELKKLNFKGELHFLSHHLCHGAGAYYSSHFNESAVLVVDGIGEFESTTLYHCVGNDFKKILQLEFPDSLGFLWEKISKFLGFSEYDACIVMGLASYGSPEKYRDAFNEIISINENGTFTINDDIINFRNEDYGKLESVFNIKRNHEHIITLDSYTKEYANIASTLQEITEIIILRLAKYLKNITGSKNLCLAGGVALNCVSNGKLIEENIFEDIYIQPASNDAGTSIGAACYIWNHKHGNLKEQKEISTPYLGPEYKLQEIKNFLIENNIYFEEVDRPDKVCAQLLADGNIISWFQGRMEFGPRALGNRSILADSRRSDMVDIINMKIKHREYFRPFCPSVLEENVRNYFELPSKIYSPYYYMLATCKVKEDKIHEIPAVVHVDNTSRIQIVNEETNPAYYRLIKEYYKITNIPLILNTSFNNSEPIVCSFEDAYHTFDKTNIDYLCLENFLIPRENYKSLLT